MLFFANRSYERSATVGRSGVVSIALNTVLGTGAGPELIREKRTNSAWDSCIRLVQGPEISYPSERVMKPWDLIYVTVHIRELQAGVPFIVVQNLAENCLREGFFVYHHLKITLPGPQKWRLTIFLLLSPSVDASLTSQKYPFPLKL